MKVFPKVTLQLAASGIRLTKQREEVFAMLLQNSDHPTAAELFVRAKAYAIYFARDDLQLPGGFSRFQPGERGQPRPGSDALLRKFIGAQPFLLRIVSGNFRCGDRVRWGLEFTAGFRRFPGTSIVKRALPKVSPGG